MIDKCKITVPDEGIELNSPPIIIYATSVMEWIRCKDQLPDYETQCLITDGKDFAIGVYIEMLGWCDPGEGYFFFKDISHWVSLPELPTVREKQEDG